MENIEKCEHIIGIWIDFEDTRTVTTNELREEIEEGHTVFSLNDYCNFRKSVNLARFRYCPECGKKIDWKAIKGGSNG